MTKKIIYIADPEILAIPIQECHEPLIDLKNQTEIAFGPIPECELTKDDYTKMRKTVYEKLCLAQKELPRRLRFQLYEGFRSAIVQKKLFDEVYANTLKRMPHATKTILFHETTRLVSPVTNFDGSKNIPAHNTGAAIDIEIIDENGDLIEMGMTAAQWNDVEPDLCLTNCDTISDAAKRNRRLLFDLLIKYGFINYPTEWWHYSYGDRYWAYHQTKKIAIYGPAD